MASFAVLLALLLTVTGLMYVGRDNAFSVYRTFTNVNTSTDSSYKKVGMLATTAQELRYMLFAAAAAHLDHAVVLEYKRCSADIQQQSYNVIESIDFTRSCRQYRQRNSQGTDEYLSNAAPTRKEQLHRTS